MQLNYCSVNKLPKNSSFKMASFQDGQERPPYGDINITEHHLQFNKSNVKLINNSNEDAMATI